jgi:hypothetical protein
LPAGLAAAVPAAVIPLPTLAIAAQSPVKPLGPSTAISKFDVERRAVRREANAVLRKIKKLDAELERRMPKPHPSITHSAENDADGLQHYPPDREPHTLHRYISSQTIEGKIRQIEQPGAAIESINGEMVMYPYRSQPMSEKDAALRDRL